MPKTVDELLTDLNEFLASDPAKGEEYATALRERVKIVSQPLINVGAKLGKRELTGKNADLTAKLQTATEQLEQTQAELTALKEKTPNVRDIEENEKRKWEPRVRQVQERAEKAEASAKKLREQVFRDKFASHLTRADNANVRMDDDPLLIRAITEQYLDRYKQNEDGTEDVLQIDNDTPYDGRTLDDKIALLASAARRAVPSKYLVTAADSGAGVERKSGNGHSQGLLTQEQILEKKRSNPVFQGI